MLILTDINNIKTMTNVNNNWKIQHYLVITQSNTLKQYNMIKLWSNDNKASKTQNKQQKLLF